MFSSNMGGFDDFEDFDGFGDGFGGFNRMGGNMNNMFGNNNDYGMYDPFRRNTSNLSSNGNYNNGYNMNIKKTKSKK